MEGFKEKSSGCKIDRENEQTIHRIELYKHAFKQEGREVTIDYVL